MKKDDWMVGFNDTTRHLNSVACCPQCEAESILATLGHVVDSQLSFSLYFRGVRFRCRVTLEKPHECNGHSKENTSSLSKCPVCRGKVQLLSEQKAFCLDCGWDNLEASKRHGQR